LVVASAAEMVVPAGGKALVPTDLSIAIPEGTYARIGERPFPFPFPRSFLCSAIGAPRLFAPQVFDEMPVRSVCPFAAPRSGLALKHSIDVGAGVIDADYRGPVGVILFNHSDADFAVKPGDRIAQMIIEVIATPEVAEVEDLDATVRGEGGFGSTGV